jgi:hypothetical protein
MGQYKIKNALVDEDTNQGEIAFPLQLSSAIIYYHLLSSAITDFEKGLFILYVCISLILFTDWSCSTLVLKKAPFLVQE